MTADQTPGHDPDRAVRDAARERERAASRARERDAYQRAQRTSRTRALGAAAEDTTARQAGSPATPSATPADPDLVRALSSDEDPCDRRRTEPTAIEAVEHRLEEAELQRALLEALATLPADQRVAVVAALGYAEGPAGAAVELDLDPDAAERLADQGLDALRHALSAFHTRDG